MENNFDSIKITYTKNLDRQNFNSTLSVPIDANVNIKTILNIDSFLFDEKVECGSGKAIVNGKIGIKVLYIDTDNQTNTISTSQSFSETFIDSSISSDGIIVLSNTYISNTILSMEGTLKLNCEISLNPLLYLNLGIDNKSSEFENMITKKSEIQTNSISNTISNNFEYTTNLETKDSISKILSYDAYFSLSSVASFDDYAVIEGKLHSSVLYETQIDGEIVIKEIVDTFNVKSDISIEGLKKDDILDLNFSIDKSQDSLTTESEDDNNIITVVNRFKITGVSMRTISLEVIDDMYSPDSEIEINLSNREFIKNIQSVVIEDNISNDITLNADEPAIDDLISNLHIVPEITNSYIKDDSIYVEGIITSQLAYLDENREYRQKLIQVPFLINTKTISSQSNCTHSVINIVDCKTKVKRGTIIEMEYSLLSTTYIYEKDSREIVDNITLGKSLDFSMFDYQIYLAKAGESRWELCKRIKISPDDLEKCNKDLPLIMNGGEKIIIKR